MIKSTTSIALKLAAILPLAGCCVPHEEIQSYGVSGVILDGATHSPIKGAIITAPDPDSSAISDTNGAFKIPPTYKWRLFKMIDPSFGPPEPTWILAEPTITVSVEGRIEHYKIEHKRGLHRDPLSTRKTIEAQLEDDTFTNVQIQALQSR